MGLLKDIDIADSIWPKGDIDVRGLVHVDRDFVHAYHVAADLDVKVCVLDSSGNIVAGPVGTASLAGGDYRYFGFLLHVPGAIFGDLLLCAYQSKDVTLTLSDGSQTIVAEADTGRAYRAIRKLK